MLLLAIGVARAHVGLEDPPPRYPSDGYADNKACPCGVGPNDQTCSNPGARSDPNRSGDVTTYDAGQPLTIKAHEVVGHTGRWRIAFDADGADLDDFNANILLDIADPPGGEGNVDQGDLWEFEVVLPNVPCTNCTLQVIQVMNGNTSDPVPDPTGESTYYQCADIVLLAGSDTGNPTTPTVSDTDTGAPTTPSDTDTDTDEPSDTGPAGDPSDRVGSAGGGCACDAGANPLGAGWMGLAVLLWVSGRASRGWRPRAA